MLGNSGNNPWDVPYEMVPAVQQYGLTVPMFFCPSRPSEFGDAQTWFSVNANGPSQATRIAGHTTACVSRAYAEGHADLARRARIVWRHFGNGTSFY